MEQTAFKKQRVGQHQYAMTIPLPLFEKLEDISATTGETIKNIILNAVRKELGVEGE